MGVCGHKAARSASREVRLAKGYRQLGNPTIVYEVDGKLQASYMMILDGNLQPSFFAGL